MDERIGRLMSGLRKDKETVQCSVEGNAMIIDCSGCELMPEPGTPECMRCMVDRMSGCGGTERIILRTGKDLEISGNSAKAIRGIASLKRWSVPLKERDRRCRRCGTSRTRVMNVVWESFPDPGFHSAKELLGTASKDESCASCLRLTARALEQLESDLERIRLELLG